MTFFCIGVVGQWSKDDATAVNIFFQSRVWYNSTINETGITKNGSIKKSLILNFQIAAGANILTTKILTEVSSSLHHYPTPHKQKNSFSIFQTHANSDIIGISKSNVCFIWQQQSYRSLKISLNFKGHHSTSNFWKNSNENQFVCLYYIFSINVHEITKIDFKKYRQQLVHSRLFFKRIPRHVLDPSEFGSQRSTRIHLAKVLNFTVVIFHLRCFNLTWQRSTQLICVIISEDTI